MFKTMGVGWGFGSSCSSSPVWTYCLNMASLMTCWNQGLPSLCKHLDLGALQKVLIGSSSPWRGLKALANQARPPFQLILPQELADAVKGKADSESGQDKEEERGKVRVKVLLLDHLTA